MTVLLIVVAVAFAFSMGAHYTGACMGMPHALRAVSAWQALAIMAPLAFVGAALGSHGVEHTVGDGLVAGRLTVSAQVIVVAVAFALTSAFNRARVPTSTIQILVFSVIGVALAAGAGVAWHTIGLLAAVWVAAPVVAAGLGYLLTRLMDRVPGVARGAAPAGPGERARAGSGPTGAAKRSAGMPAAPSATPAARQGGGRRRAGEVVQAGVWLAPALTAVGAAASFTMGANDVANATGSLVGTGVFSPLAAGAAGGAGLALGVLTWGRPLLAKVAFDVVTVDRPMATAAQMVQAGVVLTAVAFGLFTSMNQALVGAMTGAGVARGRRTVNASSLYGILRGWVIGPGAGLALGYLVAVAAATGGAALLTHP